MVYIVSYKDLNNFSIFENLEEMSESLQNLLFLEFSHAISENRRYHLALSGGSTPLKILRYLLKNPLDKINYDFLHLYWGDERFVPQNDSESNFGTMWEGVLRYSNIPDENIHRILGENSPEEEVKRYSSVLGSYVPLENGIPRFDMILLGLGEDGHTASIFPDSSGKLDTEDICYIASHPVTKQKRLTLSMKVLNNSRSIIFLVSGSAKAKIIKEVIFNKKVAEKYPAAHVNPINGSLKWFIDKDAGRKLKSKISLL